MTRATEIGEFLAQEGWGWAKREPLAGDASARRYERLRRGGRLAGAILMDMPPESGLDVRPFLAVTAWLRAGRFSAPEVLGADSRRGLVLLEDLGDDLFAVLCAREPKREAGLYGAAIDLLADLQRRPPPGADVGWTPPPYDMALMLREARLIVEWYLPAATGRPAPPDLAAEFDALAEAAFAGVAAARQTAVLARLPRREPALAAAPRRPCPRRHARLPGHAGRPPRLRPDLAPRGRPPRRLRGAPRRDARALPRAERRRPGGVRRGGGLSLPPSAT